MLGSTTSTRHPRTSIIAISLATALLVASCGTDDDAAASETVATTSLDVSSTAPMTTASPTTTTAITTTPPTTVPPSSAPPTTTSAPTTAAPAALEYCGDAGVLPATAVLESSLMLDVLDDGTADDLVEAYDVDGWSRLRLTTGGSVVSEIISPAIDGRYRPLGVASVFPGDSAELFAVIGEGSAATEVGVFGLDTADCLFTFRYAETSEDFTMLIRATSPFRSGAFCFDGGIGLVTAEQRSDGMWDASSAAFEADTFSTVRYLGASDDYSEGLDESELSPFEFDCFGLEL